MAPHLEKDGTGRQTTRCSLGPPAPTSSAAARQHGTSGGGRLTTQPLRTPFQLSVTPISTSNKAFQQTHSPTLPPPVTNGNFPQKRRACANKARTRGILIQQTPRPA